MVLGGDGNFDRGDQSALRGSGDVLMRISGFGPICTWWLLEEEGVLS